MDSRIPITAVLPEMYFPLPLPLWISPKIYHLQDKKVLLISVTNDQLLPLGSSVLALVTEARKNTISSATQPSP